MLHWLTFSVRTISLKEGVEVLAADPDADDGLLFDPGRRPWDPRKILDICPSLLTITVLDVMTVPTFQGEIDPYWERIELAELRLAHFSVREYLTSDYLRQCDNKLSFFHFDQKMANTTIAKTCLAYLLQFTQHGCVNSSTKESYPLSDYAAYHWMDHAREDGGDSDTLHRLIMDFLQPHGALYTNWLLFRWRSRQKSLPLYDTALGGLKRATECLLEDGSDVNAVGGHYGSALQASSLKGHEDIVRLLLEKGADVNMEGGVYGSALQAASSQGHESIARLLLEKGADANVHGGDYANALQAASFEGHEDIVRLLLEKGADVNIDYGSALYAASSRGHENIVRLLLEKGAEAGVRGALKIASSKGHGAVAALLEAHFTVNGNRTAVFVDRN